SNLLEVKRISVDTKRISIASNPDDSDEDEMLMRGTTFVLKPNDGSEPKIKPPPNPKMKKREETIVAALTKKLQSWEETEKAENNQGWMLKRGNWESEILIFSKVNK